MKSLGALLLRERITLGIFHLPKNSGNSGLDVNGTRFVGLFHWKFSRVNRTSEKDYSTSPVFPLETCQWKFVFHLQISHLSHQSQAFHGIFYALLQLRWRFSLLTPEFTRNYMNAKKCFSCRIVGFPYDCFC